MSTVMKNVMFIVFLIKLEYTIYTLLLLAVKYLNEQLIVYI